jgi:hypothetical protein
VLSLTNYKLADYRLLIHEMPPGYHAALARRLLRELDRDAREWTPEYLKHHTQRMVRAVHDALSAMAHRHNVPRYKRKPVDKTNRRRKV